MIKVKNYLIHHLALIIILVLGATIYLIYQDFQLRNIIVLVTLILAFTLNVTYHIKHADLTKGIVFEYFLISLFIYLLFLFVHLF